MTINKSHFWHHLSRDGSRARWVAQERQRGPIAGFVDGEQYLARRID